MGEVRTLSIGPTSDLVVKCPWSPGIIQADEPILPRTRLILTFRTLFELRKRSRESLDPFFADPIERLERIHSFRLAGEEDGLRLSVTYDFGWETYMQDLWSMEGGGPFLDLLCCHCKGYALARETTPDLWSNWIRNNQVQSDYFYSATGLTVGDLAVLSHSERLQRRESDPAKADRALAGFCTKKPSDVAKAKRLADQGEAQRQAIGVIAAMYRLTRYWSGDVEHSLIPKDAITLIVATRALIENQYVETSFHPDYEGSFASALAWYRQEIGEPKRFDGTLLSAAPLPTRHDPADIQKGILTSFDKGGPAVARGAAVFLAVTDAKKARQYLADLELATEGGGVAGDGVLRNLAFTHAGLQRLLLDPRIIESAPRAFREGAAARAGSVGDVRAFHPSKWRPLRRNWPPNPKAEVGLEQVDMLIQLRAREAPEQAPTDQEATLNEAIEALGGESTGLAILAVEWLAPAGGPGSDKGQLGFSDGLSQPALEEDAGKEPRLWSDKVEPGALLVGRGSVPAHQFWLDGSFMAVRRMPIDPPKFEAVLCAGSQPGCKDSEALAAKLVGRNRNGTQIVTNASGNDFDFTNDPEGAVCPLDSHIRRANPRTAGTPRIIRRGMSFVRPADPRDPEDKAEQGSFFVAYCADLAEQYERILGWVNGGNSTRIGSYLSDPLSGVPEHEHRTYRFIEDDKVQRLTLPLQQDAPIALSWSHYFFAPSVRTVKALETLAGEQANGEVELAERGRLIIARLQAAGAGPEVWRSVLNEPGARDQNISQAVWAAIRTGTGIIDTPVGYLVGRYDLVMEVLRDRGERFSSSDAGERTKKTIGPFHLGMDPCGEDYDKLATTANQALRSVGEKDAFDLAYAKTQGIVGAILKATSDAMPEIAIDLLPNLIEPVFAAIAPSWFGIPDGTYVRPGARSWTVPAEGAPPNYPGHFWNASRHAFNPFLSAESERAAIVEGKAAVDAVEKLFDSKGRDSLSGSVTSQMAADDVNYPNDRDLARMVVGCMIGGVPTVAGNAVRMLVGGLENGKLERAQRAWLWRTTADPAFKAARDMFGADIGEGLARDPIPELLRRVVASDGDRLGGQPLEKGRMLIFSLESAGREQLARGKKDNYIPFGMALVEDPAQQPLPKQPPHGCPGRDMANGIMLGLLVGLLESAQFKNGPARGMATLRPLP